MTTEINTVKYYVGDLCYVMNDAWSEVCDLIPFDNSEHEFELKDGRKFILFGTTYGDGSYSDFAGNSYGVDSGTIGAVKVDDIRDLEGLAKVKEGGIGHIHDFPSDFTSYDCNFSDGVINIYNVSIDTGSFDCEMSDEDESEEDF